MKSSIYFPIKITITVSFFLTILTVVSIIIGFNYIETSKSALLTAEQLMESKSRRIFVQIDNLYKPLSYLVQQASTLPAVGTKPTLQTHPAQDYMINAMKIYKQIQIQYIGFQDGDFYGIYSLNENYIGSMRENTHAPEDAAFAIVRQYTPATQNAPVRLWRYLNDKEQTIGSYKERNVSYDPRNRGWYQSANENGGIRKSAPYLFDNSKQFGVTVSTCIDGATPGVYGVDILLSEIAEFLNKVKDSENETIIIFNQDLQITAAPDSGDPVSDSPLPFLRSSGNELLLTISEKLEELGLSENMTLNLKIQRKEYLIKIMEIPDLFENKEYILIGIPQDDILGPIAQNSILNLVYSFILFLLAIPLIILISAKISGPITKLAAEANTIHQYDFTRDIQIQSNIKEIHELTTEMANMKRGLRYFNKYVPSRLVRHLLESNIDFVIGGRKRNIAIMFTDIENFTSIAEAMEPEDLMQHLSGYFEKTTKIIRSYNGLVDKYIGDAVMAFWNAPSDDPHYIKHACRAAMDINREINGNDKNEEGQAGVVFKTRIGIDTGEAVVGNVGSSDRMNYTVIGDTVNNASRLEGVNKIYNTQILISQRVADQIEDEFLVCPVAKVLVKGKSIVQDIYELVDYRQEADPSEINYTFHFINGFRLFYGRQWIEAEKAFKKANTYGQSLLASQFIKSCQEFVNVPPPPEWTGVRIIRGK